MIFFFFFFLFLHEKVGTQLLMSATTICFCMEIRKISIDVTFSSEKCALLGTLIWLDFVTQASFFYVW